MKKPKLPKLSGKSYGYLKHFAQEKWISKGHNDVDEVNRSPAYKDRERMQPQIPGGGGGGAGPNVVEAEGRFNERASKAFEQRQAAAEAQARMDMQNRGAKLEKSAVDRMRRMDAGESVREIGKTRRMKMEMNRARGDYQAEKARRYMDMKQDAAKPKSKSELRGKPKGELKKFPK